MASKVESRSSRQIIVRLRVVAFSARRALRQRVTARTRALAGVGAPRGGATATEDEPATGKRTWKAAPPSRADVTHTVPWKFSTIRGTMARPRPVALPAGFVVKKGSK